MKEKNMTMNVYKNNIYTRAWKPRIERTPKRSIELRCPVSPIYNYILLVKFSMRHSLIFVALLNSDHFFVLNRDNDPLRNSMQFFSALYRHFTIWLRYSQCFFAVIHSKFMTQIFHVEISCFFFNFSSTFLSNHSTAFVSKHLFSQLFHHWVRGDCLQMSTFNTYIYLFHFVFL